MRLDRFLLTSILLLGSAALAWAAMRPIRSPIPTAPSATSFDAAGPHHGLEQSVAVDHQGHVWVVDRCGANDCANSKLDPVMEFDAKGHFLKSFGAGKFLFRTA